MHDVETMIGLLVAVAAVAWLAARIRVPYPVLLVLAGLAISFIPHLPPVELRPDLVFLLFLPPLLYYPGLLTSWRDFQRNLRPISFLAIGLVLFTTCVIAAVGHWFIDGLPWSSAFVLGAIISPPDAIAASAILQRLRIPKRLVTILEGESLVNDATAIVAYRFATIAVVTGAFSLWAAGLGFFVVAAGGVGVGLVAGWAVTWVRPRLHDQGVEGIVSLLTPFIAYLPAEWIGVSGVLATVTAGVYIGRRIPQITNSQTRLRLYAVWETLVFLLNGVIFILIGLQLRGILARLSDYRLSTLIAYAALVSFAAVAVRFAWVFPATYVPRLLFPSLRARDPMPPWRAVFLIAWVGLRGIVSLAAALALPLTLKDNVTPFPGRDLIIFITFGVIVTTLVLQGLTLPAVIRWLRLQADDEEVREENLARLEAAHAALARLEVLSYTNEEAAEMIARVRVSYEERIRYYSVLTGRSEPAGDEPACRSPDEVMRFAITAEREMLIQLRNDGTISDEVLRRVQQELDLDEAKLAAG